jgi:tRNA A-37 threonylcarbamoyl transferase component Bud32
MADDEHRELEEGFKERNETLRGFYNTGALTMSEDELASLTPILNALKDHVARYQELAHIAEGGEKKITLVHDHRLDRKVAMARAAHAKTPQDQEQFLREARLTANLAHPNIMPVYNMGVDPEGVPFFSMELVPGDSLKTIIKKLQDGDETYKSDFTIEILLNIFTKICDAIAFAHSRNVLHLDIKPDNIRVGEFGEVFVCDWGLARVMNTPEEVPAEEFDLLDADVLNDMTLSGTMKGTPGFMAPEQTQAYGEKTAQTDVYALGAVLYMLLTHELPVRGNSANEVVQNTREGKVIPPRRRKPDHHIPASLVAVTMKALALDPEQRYESALALRQEIGRYLTGYPTRAEHAGVSTHMSLLMRRHSRVAFLLMFFLLLLAGTIGYNLLSISREKAEAVLAREEAENNFLLYLKEQQLAKELGEDLSEAVFYTVKSRDFINAPSMIHVLEIGLADNIDTVRKKNLLTQKGTLHFVLQEFNAANQCFDTAGNSKRIIQLSALSRKYAKIKPVDKKRLSDQQLADLFNEARWADKMTLYYLYYHHMRRRPASATPENYLPLAGAVLDKMNNTRKSVSHPLNLTRQNKGNHLDLSRSNYAVFSLNIIGVYRRNVLNSLQLNSLDISHTQIVSLFELRGLKLDELRMAGVKLANKKSLAKQLEPLKLKRLVLDVKDYPPAVIEELRKKITVIDAGKQ